MWTVIAHHAVWELSWVGDSSGSGSGRLDSSSLPSPPKSRCGKGELLHRTPLYYLCPQLKLARMTLKLPLPLRQHRKQQLGARGCGCREGNGYMSENRGKGWVLACFGELKKYPEVPTAQSTGTCGKREEPENRDCSYPYNSGCCFCIPLCQFLVINVCSLGLVIVLIA